jgi:tetratricopeptide (TPR) repeat protein
MLVLTLLGFALPADGPVARGPDSGQLPWQRLLTGTDATQAEELQQQIDTFFGKGEFADALKPATKLLELRQRLQGPDHWQAEDARRQVDTLKAVATQPAAQRRALAEARSKAQRAQALYIRARYRDEEPFREEVLAGYRQVLGEDHPDTARAYNDLARCQFDQGHYAQAEPGFAKALAMRRKALGENHPGTAMAYNNLALCQQKQGRYTQAEVGLAKALAIKREALGAEHPDTAKAYNNLASCQLVQGLHAPAERGFERALAIYRKALGEEHPATARAYNNLALCQQEQGHYTQAEPALAKALAIWQKALGHDHPDTAAAYNNLALCQLRQGHYAEAEAGFAKALAIRRKVLGEDHPHTAVSYHNLAYCQNTQSRYAQAEPGFAKALAIWRQALGEEHRDTAMAYNNLANCQRDQGRYPQAEQGLARALAIWQKALGHAHPLTATAYNNLALCQQAQGRYAQAEPAFAKALAIWQKALGEDHPDTALAYYNLAYCQYAQRRYAEAQQGSATALAIRRKTLGEDHPDTASAYNNLALCQQEQGRYDQAEQGYRRALAITRKVLGEDHPDAATGYNNLANCQQEQGRYDQAEELFTHAAQGFSRARLRLEAGLGRAAFTTKHSPLLALAAVLARNGKPDLAWRTFEESLGRGTGDELAARLRRTSDERQRQTEWLARLDQIERRLPALSRPALTPEQAQERRDLLTRQRQALDALDALREELQQKYGVREGQVFTLARIQTGLAPDAALVGWIDLKGHPRAADPNGEHWGVVVRAKGLPVWVRLPGSGPQKSWTEADDELPARLLEALRQRPGAQAASWRALAQRLVRQRLEPLARHLAAHGDLPAAHHLVVLPSSMMDGIPLAALLEDRYTVSQAPSATLYAYLRGLPRPASAGLLAVADPLFRRPEAPPPPLPPGGVLLTVVIPRGNAAQAGLKPGDVILRYDQTLLTRRDDLKLRPEGEDPKATLSVQVWRDGQILTRQVHPGKLGVVLAEAPAPEALTKQRQLDRLLASRGPDGQGWPPLPGTLAEAEALQALFAAQRQPVTLLTGADASEPKLAALAQSGALGRARYLHFATHGTFDPRFPLQSAVILNTPAQVEVPPAEAGRYVFDGELTAAEVLESWHLNAELVTLSACETALGKYEVGEGFLGFAQAALLAGSRSVCLSLWRVDDAATALLMQRFYQNLLGQRDGLKGPLPKAQALAEAQQWLRTLPREEAARQAARLHGGVARDKGRPARPRLPAVPEGPANQPPYAHPYYWAAFVLIGDPD